MGVLDVEKRELHAGTILRIRDGTRKLARCTLGAQKLPQAIDFNGCFRHYETIWMCFGVQF
jgi:hypothetical protein